jgi:GNAT superfamily N-acetyltransferase
MNPQIEFRFEPVRHKVITVDEDHLETALTSGTGGTVLASVDGRIIGIAGWRAAVPFQGFPWIAWPNVPIGVPLKDHVIVAPAFRRQGIATEMWRVLVEEHGFESSEYGVSSHPWWDVMSAKYGAREGVAA